MFKKALVFASLGIVALACSSTVTLPAGGDEGGAGDGGVKKDSGPMSDGMVINTCMPGDVSTFMPSWKPPTPFNQARCTNTQINAFVDCLNGKPDAATCKTFTGDAANKSCLQCADTPATAAKYGPLVSGTVTIQVNVSGCIANATGDTSATGCGAKVLANSQCEQAACEANCPVSASDTGAEFMALLACQTKSDTSSCKTFAAAATCSDALVGDGGVANKCDLVGASFAENAVQMIKLFCGGAAGDAGPG